MQPLAPPALKAAAVTPASARHRLCVLLLDRERFTAYADAKLARFADLVEFRDVDHGLAEVRLLSPHALRRLIHSVVREFHPGLPPLVADQRREIFQVLDASGDGKIDRRELGAGLRALLQVILERLDTVS